MSFFVTSSIHLQHGPISCLSCFSAGSAPGCTDMRADWRVDNNPGYWGAAAPEVFVLGFSKGANQRSVLEFDRIAFANARENLAEVLRAVDLLDAADDIDLCFTAKGAKLGFASVIRCGLGLEVEPGKYATSGHVIRAAIAAGSKVRDLFDTCTDRFLRVLPPSVRTVVFLGLDGPYVQALYDRIRELHPSVKRIGELAYATDAVTFVHVIHPSPLATSHRQSWLRDDNNSLADKRRQVAAALGKTGYAPTTDAKTSKKAAKEAASAIPARVVAAPDVSQKHDDPIGMVGDATKSDALKSTKVHNARAAGDTTPSLDRGVWLDFERISPDGEKYIPHLYKDGLYRVADPTRGATKHHAHNQIAITKQEIAGYLQRGFPLRMRGEVGRQVNLIAASEIVRCRPR